MQTSGVNQGKAPVRERKYIIIYRMLKRARCRRHVNPYMANSGGRTARNRLSVKPPPPPPLSYITAVVYMYMTTVEWCTARIVQRVCKCRRSRRRRSYYYLKKHKSNDGEKKRTRFSRQRRRRDCEIHAVSLSSSGRPPD